MIFFNKIVEKFKLFIKTKYRRYLLLNENDKTCHITNDLLVDSNRVGCYATPRYDFESVSKYHQINIPDTHIYCYNDVSIIGGSDIILCGKNFIYDRLYFHNENTQFTDSAILRIWKWIFIDKSNAIIGHLRGEIKKVDKAINLNGIYSGNYYHFINELIPKFVLVNKANIDVDVPVILHSSIKLTKQLYELAKIFIGNRHIIYINHGERIDVNHLYSPSMVNFIPPNLKNIHLSKSEDILFDKNYMDIIRHKIISVYEKDKVKFSASKSYFISRQDCRFRKYNEQELINIVKDHVKVVYPEKMSVQEQVSMFTAADLIIAASGAALTNIIFCKPKCKIIVLISQKLDLSIFSTLAAMYDLDMVYLVGIPKDESYIQTSFYIDPNKFQMLIANNTIYE